ncbi:MAG: hypothetical protein JW821_05610 [Deltaproteobacteria bacterium]|nr:hypothetical protein [Deltaproteobacteria bacterium]
MVRKREKGWIQNLSEPSAVIRLVQGTLGCGCPREVFDTYDVQEHASGPFTMAGLTLGNRLLVWILDASRLTDPATEIRELLRRGRDERDSRGLNRFRLVIVGDLPAGGQGPISLPDASGEDERVHLHFLPRLTP